MDKDYFNILILGHSTFGIRRLRISKESFKIGVYLLAFLILSITFFFCDYIQVRKKTFLLNQLRQEAQVQQSHIQLFSAKVEDLEKKLTRLKGFDRRIRTIANLEGTGKTTSFIAMGGSSSPGIQERLDEEGDRK
ncbi:MAG TPA: hypothetical protein VEK32_01960 [Thermodesulfobacteriota bacterium]|nr:hypothetical protein [Thermodesulfobacteriota bacterium]